MTSTYAWRSSRSVHDGLFADGHLFSFLQAVRLLEELYPGRTPPGEGGDPRRELVRFRHEVRFDYPPTDVETIVPPRDGEPAQMTVNVLGLAGVLGPLPQAVTELILDLERAPRTDRETRDTAFRAFLDLFNHRLISLLYRARKKYRPALDAKAPDRGGVARTLYAFLGLGTPHLQHRLDLPDRALLPYTGLIIQAERSTVGLVRMLEDYFETTVRVTEFQGRWGVLEPEDTTRIGLGRGQNHALGASAVLGTRVWDASASFELRLGPLTLAQFLSFLPIGRAWKPLVAAVRYYVREELGFTTRLQLRAAKVPELRLSQSKNALLGWTTWLKTKESVHDDAQVRLTGKR